MNNQLDENESNSSDRMSENTSSAALKLCLNCHGMSGQFFYMI